MADVEKVVFAQLQSLTALTSIVGVNVYPNTAPQAVAPPYIIYEIQSEDRDVHAGLVNAFVDVSCVGSTYSECKAIQEAVRQVDRAYGTIASADVRGVFLESHSDAYEPPSDAADMGYFVKPLGVRLFINEATYN